jgi:uncharacterized protein YceK
MMPYFHSDLLHGFSGELRFRGCAPEPPLSIFIESRKDKKDCHCTLIFYILALIKSQNKPWKIGGNMLNVKVAILLVMICLGLSGCAPTLKELIQQQDWEQAEQQCEAQKGMDKQQCYAELLSGAQKHQAEKKIQTYIEKVAIQANPKWADRVLYYEGGYLPKAENLKTINKKTYVPIINRYLKIIHYIGKGPKSIKHGEGRFYQAAEKYFNLKRRLKDYGFQVEEMDFRRFNKTQEWKEAQENKQSNLFLKVVFQYKIEKEKRSSIYCLSTATQLLSIQRPKYYKKHVKEEPLWLYSVLEQSSPDSMRASQKKFNSQYYQLELDRHVCEAFIQMQKNKRRVWKEIIQSFPERFKGHKNIQ